MSESAAQTLRDSTAIDPSREADLLLADLDIVLRCRCCEPRDGFVADWTAVEAEPDSSFSKQGLRAVAYWGETR
jgi:hypothetical protein